MNNWAQILCMLIAEALSISPNQSQRKKICAPSEDSDQTARMRSLIRVFTGRMLDSLGCKVSPCGQRRLLSDYSDAQTDLSIPCAHMSERTFSHVVTQMVKSVNYQIQMPQASKWKLPSRKCLFSTYIKGKAQVLVSIYLVFHSYLDKGSHLARNFMVHVVLYQNQYFLLGMPVWLFLFNTYVYFLAIVSWKGK